MMFLNKEELEQLTGRKRIDAQVKALRAMGIEFILRPDGSPAVLASHIEKRFDGKVEPKKAARVEPNFAALQQGHA